MVRVSIVNWNTCGELRRCLVALPAALGGLDADVVVVDNDSGDGSADMVEREFPQVRLIRSERNLGFAGGHNQAIADPAADFALIMNPDVQLSAGSVARLIEFLDRSPDAAAVSPALMGDDGRVQMHLYRRFPSFAQVLLFWTFLKPVAALVPGLRRALFEYRIGGMSPVRVDQLPGAAMLVRGSALRTVGLLDADYFIWWEDVDWCYRASAHGFTLHVLPDVTARHTGGASFESWSGGKRVFQFYRAFYRFIAQHRLTTLAGRVTPVILADLMVKQLVMQVLSRRGIADALRRTRSEIRTILDGMRRGEVPCFTNAGDADALHPAHPAIDIGAAAQPVDVIIVNWNGRRFLPRCIEAVAGSTVPVRITVVDNDSTDGSADYVRASHPDVVLIPEGRNGGYAAGANTGLRRTGGAFALVMNPDVLVEPEYIGILRDRLVADGRIGIAQGKLFTATANDFIAGTPRGRIIDSAGHVIRRSRMVVDRGQGLPDGPGYNDEASVFSACGAALFLRRAMLDDVAPDGEYFAESFFAYKEDVDLGWRARLLGWDVRYIPDAVAHHVRGLPFEPGAWKKLSLSARRHSWKNHYLLMLRNDRFMDVLRNLPFIAAWEVLRLGHAILRDPRVLTATIDAIRSMGPALRLRRNVLSRRRTSPDEIRRWFGTGPIPVSASTATPLRYAGRSP